MSKAYKGSNSGFNRFLALHRGARGGRKLSGMDRKTGAVYAKGPYKGQTEGEGDVQAFKTFQGMSDADRDKYRAENKASMEEARARAIQAQRDQYALAREFGQKTREDERNEQKAIEEEEKKKKVPDFSAKPKTKQKSSKTLPVAKARPFAASQNWVDPLG